jgi:hypothetical protein
MVGAKRTRRAIAAVAGQESAALRLRERCRAQRPLRSARWASCERADLLARWGRWERTELRSVGSLPPRPRFGREESAPLLSRKSGQVQPQLTQPVDPCSRFLQRRTVGQLRGSLIRAMGVRSVSDSRGDRALSAHGRSHPDLLSEQRSVIPLRSLEYH